MHLFLSWAIRYPDFSLSPSLHVGSGSSDPEGPFMDYLLLSVFTFFLKAILYDHLSTSRHGVLCGSS